MSISASHKATDTATNLPDEDHADNDHEYAGDDLLFSLPGSQASVHSAMICNFARVCFVCLVWKRPCHVPRIHEAAALESILDLADGTRILLLKQRLPALMQPAIQARRRRSMRARKGNHDGGVDEDERVCDDDKRRALNLATAQVLATLLSTREVIAAFQQEA